MPDDPLQYLLNLPRYAGKTDDAFKPGLDRIRALLAAMDNPQRNYPSVHIGGTNGKGSTAAMVSAVLSAGEKRVGLHTSPHILSVTERMRLNGTPAPDNWLAGAVKSHFSTIEDVQPSFFEATVALSLLYFAEQAVDIAVVEVGLGGRLDATNILEPRVCVITEVGFEHTDILGDTLPEIAREKAGIIKAKVPLYTGVRHRGALKAIGQRAEQLRAPFHAVWQEAQCRVMLEEIGSIHLNLQTPARQYDALKVALPGAHQAGNAMLAVRVAEELDVAEEAIREGLRRVPSLSGMRYRGEVLHEKPLILADVAHNAESLAAVLAHAKRHIGGRLVVALAIMRDKNAGEIARLLQSLDAAVLPVALPSERALPADELIAVLEEARVDVAPPDDLPSQIARFKADADAADGLVITGSHYLMPHVENWRKSTQGTG